MNLFDFFTLVWFAITIVGWIAYKCKLDNVDSWEAGVKYCTVGVIRWIWEEITGKSNSKNIINLLSKYGIKINGNVESYEQMVYKKR